MRIFVLDAPLGCEFREGVAYLVYELKEGELEGAFVFDEEGELHFVTDLDWEEVTSNE